MRYLGNANNLVRSAVVTALNIVPSEAMYRRSVSRTGGGQVRLAGSYDGQADTTIDVEIRNDTVVDAPRLSAPTFAGVGNGTLTNASATADVSAQRLDVTLVDLGTDTRQAYVPFQGVTLRAVDAGAGGNAITISVDEAGVTRTDSNYATADDMRADFNEYVGDEWNFGHAVLTPEGTIPTGAPRLAFGDDPQVYRAYKDFKDGRYVYSFSPAIVRDVPKGTVVRIVSGSRTVTVTDGVDTDTYPGVTTLYSLLSQIAGDADALLEVDGAVVNDQFPGGMGVVEMSTRTSSYAKATVADGSSYAKDADIGLVVAADAPTETLTIECTNAERVGSETWQVKGTLSGELAPATTGTAYDGAHYDFKIPHIESRDTTEAASLTYKVFPADRSAAQADPDILLYRPVLGRNARDLELTYTYQRRPAPECDATDVAVTGSPNPDCLGLEPEGVPVAITPRHQARLERISQFVNRFTRVQQNPFILQSFGSNFVETLGPVARQLAQSLSVLMDNGELDHDAWAVATVYEEGDIVVPTAANGLRYRAENAGTSHAATQPSWPTAQDGTVTDNGITWRCIGKTPLGMFDECLDLIESDYEFHLKYRALSTMHVWAGSTAYAAHSAVYPTTRNGRVYLRTAPNEGSSSSAASEPAWPTTDFGTVADSGITWMSLPRYWAATTAFGVGDIGFPVTTAAGFVSGYFRVKTAGTTGASEPAWEASDFGEITDGTVVWEYIQFTMSSLDPAAITPEVQLRRVNALIGPALAAAGLEPDFEQASSTGNGCWRDDEDATHWWVCSDASYLPAFTGVYYHATRTGYDQEGNQVITPTMEFGFAIQACGMIEGDAVTVYINGAGGGRAYQVGDSFTTQIVRGAPLQLGGGQTGTDTLTWSVRGSVDGAFVDYELDKTAPNPYSNGGLGFQITPGGIGFRLGDTFTLFAEGGQFRWRADGGAWSADTQIEDSVAIGANGLELEFVPGAGPSFVAGDLYAFSAIAVNGPAQLQRPTDGSLAVSAGTQIEVTHAGASTVRDVLIAGHTIPDDATITLKAWNGASYVTVATIPWAEGSIYFELASDSVATKHRLDVDDACEIQWLFLGEGLELGMRNGVRELGRAIKRMRLPNGLVSRGLGLDVNHEAVTEESADELVDLVAHATENDEGRFAIVLNDEPALVSYNDESIALTDLMDFQSDNADDRYIGLSLQLSAA